MSVFQQPMMSSMGRIPSMGPTMPTMRGRDGSARVPGASDAFGDIGATALVRALAPPPEGIDPETGESRPAVDSESGQPLPGDSYRSAYSDAILEAMTAASGWGHKQRKYTDRHADYLDAASQQIGSPFAKIEVPRGYESTAYVLTHAKGKRYIIDTPHSPGGSYNDISLGQGAIGLGLGNLGGSGKYKNLPAGAGASYIPWEAYRGDKPGITEADDINIKESGGLGGLLGPLATITWAPR
jgi:hypothetical protein